nr:MAG TPA: hypothetical protein [Bacteriophage sp.]
MVNILTLVGSSQESCGFSHVRFKALEKYTCIHTTYYYDILKLAMINCTTKSMM